jgi:pyruvate,orthophosphate dikinase
VKEPDSRHSPAATRTAAHSVEQVLDEHAELRDLLQQLEDADDARIVVGLLDRLQALLAAHFGHEEEDEGVLRAVANVSADLRAALDVLMVEHRGIFREVSGLACRMRRQDGDVAAVVKGEIEALLERLREHDARETHLVREAVAESHGMSIDPSPGVPAVPSGALEINLRRTAVDVVVPTQQTVLLEVTAHLHGVQEETRKLLREVNHRYVGWPQTVEDLHRRSMSDFAHHVRHPRAAEAVAVLCSLYARAVREALPVSLRPAVVRNYVAYLEHVVRNAGDRLDELLPMLGEALEELRPLIASKPELAAVASPRLKLLARTLLARQAPAKVEQCLLLFRASLRCVYETWLQREDPAIWWRQGSGAAAGAPLPEPVAAISHARLRACLEQLHKLPAKEGEALLALPDAAQIERGYLEAAASVESSAGEGWQKQLARIGWLIRLLSVDELTPVHEQALNEINYLYLDVLRRAQRSELEKVVRETFAALRHSRLSSSQTAVHLVVRIGAELIGTDDAALADMVVDEILQHEFPFPGFSGFTDEWQVRVDPAHLRMIRAYLALVETSPVLTRRLLAALVVQLKTGGVFVADTDLFQKDVSRLLAGDIEPVFHQAKHLLRLFPVYYNDIGAEGELRDVSTRIDEITGRRDPLCHFLRKQCHVESNPLLVPFVEAVADYWATGDPAPVQRYVSPALYGRLDAERAMIPEVRRAFRQVFGDDGWRRVADLDAAQVTELRAAAGGAGADEVEKVILLAQLRQLLGRKYDLHHDALLERLRAFHLIGREEIDGLQGALDRKAHEEALEKLLGILERLKQIILSRERTEAVENIYHKRHIAVGIPSMYGNYREERFEALGLTFRAESLAGALFERMLGDANLEYITKSTLQRVHGWLQLLLRALRVDGCRARSLATGVSMLEQALVSEGISVDQYVNIFQFIARGIEHLIRIRFLDVYEPVLEPLVARLIERGVVPGEAGAEPRETALKVSEAFLRSMIAQSFGLQQLDNLVGKVLRTLLQARVSLDRATLNLLMTYDAERACVSLDRGATPWDGGLYLGNKGYMIKRLAQDGFPVPHGFILTTELFRCRAAVVACEEVWRDATRRIEEQVRALERLSDCRFGDAQNPLLLSVRSGAAISMPGMLDTFLNVGINEAIAEGFAARCGSPWAAWDAYRRFLQFWGMSQGLDRDLFDGLMRAAKQRYRAAKKSHLSPPRMKDLALQYRRLLLDHGVGVLDDPLQQLYRCIELVLGSWGSRKAHAYRNAMQIADEWGTAVLVQNMVYGNLSERSGTGVVLTCDPRRVSGEVQLYGDFIVQGQGDDVVSGLVETFPITETQRRAEAKAVLCPWRRIFRRSTRRLLRTRTPSSSNKACFTKKWSSPSRATGPATSTSCRRATRSCRRRPGCPLSCRATRWSKPRWRRESRPAAALSAVASLTAPPTSRVCASAGRESRSSCCGRTRCPTMFP